MTTINNSTTGILTTPDAIGNLNIQTANNLILQPTGNVTVQTAGVTALTVSATNQCVGYGMIPDGSSTIQIAAGTATTAPLELTSSAGVLMTTPDGGSIEYDGVAFYGAVQDSQRGVIDSEQFITLTANYTTSTGTGGTLKQLFNTPTSGTLTVAGNTTYFFECMFRLTSMSSTSGSFDFGLGGTATLSSVLYTALANKTATSVQTAMNITLGTAATGTTLISTNNTTTTGYAMIRGKIAVTTAGTIIPQFALSTAAAAVVNTGSYFRLVPVGSNSVNSVGNWS
jgi:hypothetical protein